MSTCNRTSTTKKYCNCGTSAVFCFLNQGSCRCTTTNMATTVSMLNGATVGARLSSTIAPNTAGPANPTLQIISEQREQRDLHLRHDRDVDDLAGLAHDSPRAQMCTFQGPALQKHHQNSTQGPQERERRMKIVAEEGKKARNFGPPHPSGLHPSAPPFWAPPFWAPPFWAPPFEAPLFLGLGPSPFGRPPPFWAPAFWAPPFGPTLRGPTFSRFGASTLWAPHPSGLHPSGLHPSGPHPSGPHPSGPHFF